MKKICPACKTEFETGTGTNKKSTSIYCTPECQGNPVRLKGIPSGTIGAMSEFIICADLLSKGYSVFRSISQCAFCDIIIYKDSKMLKVEAKTLPAHSKPTLSLVHSDVDIVACYSRFNNEITYFNMKLEEIKL